MPDEQERRQIEVDRADRQVIEEAAAQLRQGAIRAGYAGTEHKHFAFALAPVLDELALHRAATMAGKKVQRQPVWTFRVRTKEDADLDERARRIVAELGRDPELEAAVERLLTAQRVRTLRDQKRRSGAVSGADAGQHKEDP